MSIIKSPYSVARINLLRQMLFTGGSSGKTPFYEVRVDDLRVVARTNNPEEFDQHEEFVSADTRSITVLIYAGTSRNNTRYVLQLKDEPFQNASPALAGTDIEETIREKVQQHRKEWEYQQTQQENQRLKSQVELLQKKEKEQQEQIRELLNSPQGDGQSSQRWGSILSIALEGLIKRNAHHLSKIPGGESLFGLFNQSEDKQAQPAHTPQQQQLLALLELLQGGTDPQQLDDLMRLSGLLLQHPEAIPNALQSVEVFITNQPVTDNNKL
ncbi:MAG: hypothetical protein K1X81_11480 [Bacteroidia bacterium]|nr:hypothetical protein [Bacteroidia bacterium]